MFDVVHRHPSDNILWAEAPCDGWGRRESVHPEKYESYELHNHPAWYLLERDSVVYPTGSLLYCYVESLYFLDMLVIGADVQVDL